MTTEFRDLITITLTSRSEPFEGIIENINFQCGEVSAVISDFRRMKLCIGDKKYSYKYFPKDVGHKKAINQPWDKEKRNFYEIEISTTLMLVMTDMVRSLETRKKVNPSEILRSLKAEKDETNHTRP